MLQLGKLNTMQVIKRMEFGIYLGIDDKEILMPTKWVPANIAIGDELDAFVYRDSEDRLIATTMVPFAEVGEFAFLEVKEVTSIGAFLDWGMEKDLLVPFGQQAVQMNVGNSYVVYIYVDEITNRVVATSKLKKYFDEDTSDLEENDVVDLLIYSESELGFSTIVNNRYSGLIYRNEIFETIRIGDKLKGFIYKIRENGKLDIRIQKSGFELVDDVKWKIFQTLQQQNGFLPYNDNSTPEEIKDAFQISKKAFKKAIGALYKERKINIVEKGIEINKPKANK
jgi:predicted RNA-binding protein (virulence factor B family)